MKLERYYEQSILNLLSNKLRSILAILGIVIGSASIVALISSGQLATNAALAQFKNLGTNLLSVAVYQTRQQPASNEIALDVWRQMPEDIPIINNIAPYSTAYQPISYQSNKINALIIGADEKLAKITDIKLNAGIFVSNLASFEHICVIGANVRKQLQQINFEDPIGKQLRVGNTLYTIIGIASLWQENVFFNEDINQAVIIPIAGMALVSQNSHINNAILSLQTDDDLNNTMESIKKWVEQKAPNFGVYMRSAKQIVESMQNQGHIFNLLLLVIGSIAMLVGGIGVMNIMLVAVAERKKEIGLRKALGAKNKEIQMLFLVESVILSLLGGCIGVLAGLIVTYIIAHFNNWSYSLNFLPIIIGFGISVITGIFFGFYPARRASFLEPVSCLRAEN